MTKAQLIQALAAYPDDMEVVGENDDGRYPTDICVHSGKVENKRYNQEWSESGQPVIVIVAKY